MKLILFDMGPLTLVRWPLYRDLKVWHTLQTRIQAEKGSPTEKLKKKKWVLKWSLDKIQGFKTMFILFFVVENQALLRGSDIAIFWTEQWYFFDVVNRICEKHYIAAHLQYWKN